MSRERVLSRVAATTAALACSFGFAVPARAAEVVLDFLQAKARIEGRDVASLFGDPQDFFPVVTVAGVPGPRAVMSNNDFPSWATYQVRVPVDPALRFYTVGVQLGEADIGGSDEPFDIHPAAGPLGYNFTFDACLLTYRDAALVPFMPSIPKDAQWLPIGNGDLGNPDKDAEIKIRISTGDGAPFTVNDVAIARAGPVQAAYDARRVIADKPLSFMVRLESTFTGSVNASVTVSLSDGVTSRVETKAFLVPPEGLTGFLFDTAPFYPAKHPTTPRLRYDVSATVGAETHLPESCEAQNNFWAETWIPIVRTQDKRTVYRAFDAPQDSAPADLVSTSELQLLFDRSEPFRRATFPLATLDARIDGASMVAPGEFPFNNVGVQLIRADIAAASAGIDRMILVPRQGSLVDIGLTAPGVSLGRFARRAVFVEHNTFTTVSHELGHTFELSRRNCTNGGLLEDWFRAGCMDEYDHPSPPRPYIAKGYDVLGTIYPSGSGGGAPGTNEVVKNNLMDTNGTGYARWIDAYSFDILTEGYRLQGDPPLIGIWGMVEMPGGLHIPPNPFLGTLQFAYRFDGVPDIPAPPIGSFAGAGRFLVRIRTQSGSYDYRFNPGYALDETTDGDERGYFSMSVPWPPEFVTFVELWGPADVSDPLSPANQLLASIPRTVQVPSVTTLRAGRNIGPPLGGPQPEPPTIGPNDEAVVVWLATDADSPALRTIVHLKPPAAPGQFNDWLPMAVEVVGNELRLPHDWLREKPGSYSGRVLVSDGINTTTYLQSALFTICNLTNGGVEICDGLDNNCNGTVDDLAPFPSLSLLPDKITLSWTPAVCAGHVWDVASGLLSKLRGTGGFSSAVCVEDDSTNTTSTDAATPPPADGFYYLVRVEGATWNDGTQAVNRDATISVCP